MPSSIRVPLFILLAVLVFICGLSSPAKAMTQEDAFLKAVQDFEKLQVDPKKGKWREPWENLQKQFARVQGMDAPLAVESLFYQARAREELAERSRNPADFNEAISLYNRLVKHNPGHALADNSLYNKAFIQADRLRQKSEAVKTLDELIRKYPNSEMVGAAQQLKNTLTGKKPSQAAPIQTKPNTTSGPPATYVSPAAMGYMPPNVRPGTGADEIPAETTASQNTTPNPTKPAEPAPKTTTDNTAGKTAEAEQKELYDAAAKKWRTLVAKKPKDAAPWHALEKDFNAALAAAPKGPLADKASYQAARCLEEGAERAKSVSDFKKATELFAQTAMAFPKSNLADDSLYRQAEIMGEKLDDPVAASFIAREIISKYPKGDMLPRAKTLLKKMTAKEQAAKAAAASGALATANSNTSTPPKTKPGDIVEQLGLSIKTVVIDAGHGGKDPGAIGNGIKESNYTLSLSKLVGQRLQKQGIKVLYTRDKDKYIALDERTRFANSSKADIFISIHLNSSENKNLNGFETYYLDDARSDVAKIVAARENGVDINKTNDLQFILSDLTLSGKKTESKELAGFVQSQVFQQQKSNNFRMKDNGVRSAPFFVLMGARMPAVLVEIGYISNKNDADKIKTKKYLETVADGVVAGILAYKKKLSAAKL